jgi:hypothetical protein
MAVSQAMGWQRAGGKVIGLGAGLFCLFVSAAMKMPIACQLRAGWSLGHIPADSAPSRPAMLAHVVCSDLI